MFGIQISMHIQFLNIFGIRSNCTIRDNTAQEPLIERSKHEHEENSLHDHWGENEHSHSHQVTSTLTSRRKLEGGRKDMED